MEKLYLKFKEIIVTLFNDNDIKNILKDPLKSDFETNSLQLIEKESHNKVVQFFREFENCNSQSKYKHLVEVTPEISDWIAEFLLATDLGNYADLKLKTTCNLINLYIDFYVENLEFGQSVIKECLDDGLISISNYDILTKCLEKDGLMITKWRLMDIIHIRSSNAYAKFLYLSYKHNRIFIELFCDNLNSMLESTNEYDETKNIIQMYSNSIIDDNITDVHSNNPSVAYMESQSKDTAIPKNRTDSLFHTNSTASPVRNNSNDRTASSIRNNSNDSNALHKQGYDDFNGDDDDEDVDFDDLLGELKDKSVKEILNFQSDNKSQKGPIQLSTRKYQEELAEKGISGLNVLICAPTGSGKTIVAVKIVEEHFKSQLDAKIAFIVPTNALVEQQYNQFRRYLRKYKVVRQSGNTKPGNVPLAFQIRDNDIFILTSDILKNALDESLCSIADFSLVIFDECHHCDKGHSYNKVMNHYFKNRDFLLNVPQIIGMTASTGTDKAKSIDSAVNSLFSLCANLDCQVVSTVKLNVPDLDENINVASQTIITPGYRYFDDFEDCLMGLLLETEKKVVKLCGNLHSAVSIPQDKFHDKYINFTSDLSKKFPISVSDDASNKIRNLATYLEMFYRALLVNNLFTSQKSLEMIKGLATDTTVDFEKDIQQDLKNFLSTVTLEQDKNPSLKCLTTEINEQLKLDKKSKIIIFVKEVNYAKILESELNNAKIPDMKCASVVGTNKSAELGGATSSSVSDTLAKFRSGFINVICCTSVVEEGLDIDLCNLVIRYGHVTNETSMIQARGRARADKSRYILIVPHRLEWQVRKEAINKFRETMMYKAIEKFQNMTKSDISKKISELQIKRQIQSGDGSINDNKDAKKSSSVYKLHCKKCSKYLCDSTDIRVVKGNSYVVINKDKFPNLLMSAVDKNNYPIICSCNQKLGFIHKHQNVPLPSIRLKDCKIRNGTELLNKSWKDAPFTIPDITNEELSNANSETYRV